MIVYQMLQALKFAYSYVLSCDRGCWSVQRSASASSWAYDWIWAGGSGPSARLFWSQVYGQKIFDQYASKCLEWLTEGWLVLPKFECCCHRHSPISKLTLYGLK